MWTRTRGKSRGTRWCGRGWAGSWHRVRGVGWRWGWQRAARLGGTRGWIDPPESAAARGPPGRGPNSETLEKDGMQTETNDMQILKLNPLKSFFLMCHSYPAPAGGVLSASWCYTACSRTSARPTPTRGGWRWSPSRSCPTAPHTAGRPQTHCSHIAAGIHRKQRDESSHFSPISLSTSDCIDQHVLLPTWWVY